ncbi:hypothetical protein BUE65_21860, partial [Klebsiella variicola]
PRSSADARELVVGTAERGLAQARASKAYRFALAGYVPVGRRSANECSLVFNRTVGLRDTWAKVGE